MIDADGYRLNVGIILVNQQNQLFWARRYGQKGAWQFPQGGMRQGETPEQALYRELTEEIGLDRGDVAILGCTRHWLTYELPRKYIRYYSKPLCIGQKQKWFLLRLLSSENKVCLDNTETPEFDQFRWVSYWYPLEEVVSFKRGVYQSALKELEPLLGQ